MFQIGRFLQAAGNGNPQFRISSRLLSVFFKHMIARCKMLLSILHIKYHIFKCGIFKDQEFVEKEILFLSIFQVFCFVFFPACTGITGIFLLSWVIFLVKVSGLHV